MKEAQIDLFRAIGKVDWACITTNGDVNASGRAVMGRGCALEAKMRWPGLDFHLARLLKKRGNFPLVLGYVDKDLKWSPNPIKGFRTVLWSFPVKHHWNEPADPKLIEASARYMRHAADGSDDIEIVIPRPGCGNGRLEWNNVKALLNPILDDRFTIISNEAGASALRASGAP